MWIQMTALLHTQIFLYKISKVNHRLLWHTTWPLTWLMQFYMGKDRVCTSIARVWIPAGIVQTLLWQKLCVTENSYTVYKYISGLPTLGSWNGENQVIVNEWPNAVFILSHRDLRSHVGCSFFNCSIPWKKWIKHKITMLLNSFCTVIFELGLHVSSY